ncbi:MAG: hypothetical protein IJ456_07960 [Bacteroides sp.]|nr:hypothetical protein [Bacteroides sp.]
MLRTIAALCLCILPACMTAQTVEDFRKAMEQYDYETVIEGIAPAAGDSLLTPLRAQALKHMNRTAETIGEWNSLLSEDSTDLRVVVELAECYRQSGALPKAIACYRKATALQPANKYFRLQCIRTLLASEEYEQAKAACHEWLTMDSLSATGYKYLGQAYEGLAAVDSNATLYAFTSYNAAYRRDSLDGQTVARIANIFNNNRQYADAVEVTETYRLTDTLNLDVNRQNAKAYCLSKDYKQAVDRYEALKAMGDHTFTTLYYLGVSHLQNNWPYGGYDNLKLAHQKAPMDINVLYYLAQSCARSSYKQEGVEYMQKAIETATPTDSLMVRLYEGLAECYDYAAEPYKRIDALKEVYKWSKHRVIFYRIAQAYDHKEDYANAVHYYEKYMSLVPQQERTAVDDEGKPLKDVQTYYQLAAKRVEKIKAEDFFRNGKKENPADGLPARAVRIQ